MNAIICRAIESRRLLEFEYDGEHRVVAPYCHGVGKSGEELLRAIQVEGGSRKGGLGFGKLWTVAKMRGVALTGRRFTPNDPRYNAADSAMATIHCHIKRLGNP